MTKAAVVRLIVGRHVDLEAIRPAPRILPKPSITISNLSGGAIDGFSLSLARGEVVGLTGLIGSGYCDVIYLAFGATPAQSGTMVIAGDLIELSAMSPRRAIEIGCVLVPGDRLVSGAVPALTVSENVNQPVLTKVSRAWALAEAALLRNASALLSRFDVRPRDPRRLLGALRGGNQQKALVAKWFQPSPASSCSMNQLKVWTSARAPKCSMRSPKRRAPAPLSCARALTMSGSRPYATVFSFLTGAWRQIS